jgi:hypothetical protein
VAAAKIDVGGIEYLIDDRTGDVLFYDINALSNFVADAVNVVGFDPFERLVDYLEERSGALREGTENGDPRTEGDEQHAASAHGSIRAPSAGTRADPGAQTVSSQFPAPRSRRAGVGG